MKILQVIPFFSPKFGGSVIVPYELSKELAKRNHEVIIITSDFGFDSQYAKTIHDAGVEVIPFHCIGNFGQFFYTPSIKKWLEKNLKGFDIIHLHNFRSYQNVVIRSFAVKYGIPYIVQAHGSLPRIIEKQNLKKAYDMVWGNNILNHVSKIVAVSRSEVDQFRQAGIPNEKITVIPNAVDYISPASLPPVGQFREHLNIHKKHIILYVGRLHKRKGIEFLISAFYSFIQSWTGNDVVLVIIGPDDGYQSLLENLVEQIGLSDKVRFIGFLPSLAEAYVDADVLVYPSIYEIFGLVPFEALLCGTPVIVTNDCGCGEIIKEAECGYLVRYGDVASLSETLKFSLEHPDVNRSMVKAGRRYIEEHLSWNSVVKQVEEMYEGCVRHV